jgi:hypothetical protein
MRHFYRMTDAKVFVCGQPTQGQFAITWIQRVSCLPCRLWLDEHHVFNDAETVCEHCEGCAWIRVGEIGFICAGCDTPLVSPIDLSLRFPDVSGA